MQNNVQKVKWKLKKKQRAQAHDRKKFQTDFCSFFFTNCIPNICCLNFYFQTKLKYKFACLLSATYKHIYTHKYNFSEIKEKSNWF